jgi:maltooligosyltrehalose trehalohydrolase
MHETRRRLPGGAEVNESGTSFRVWAPRASAVDVVFEDASIPSLALTARNSGYFEGHAHGARAGARYRYQLDGKGPYPDPYSRFQPEGPHGPSMVVDPDAHEWRDGHWPGIDMQGQVIYELHVGAFTPEGTFDAATRQLPALAELGITCIELLPIAEFPGRFNWGYDGVDLYAPFHGYGDHEALKRFVDAAHTLKLGVILDVVYNHFGPDGNYLSCFSEQYFTDRYETDWGRAINFDGDGCQPVREFFIANAAYWIREFHLDGLRLDATQSVHDRTRPHVLVRIAESARTAAGSRRIIIVAENEPQRGELLVPEGGIDALWNDDFHHSARVALTGSYDGYFHDYRGRAQEFVSMVRRGFLFQGQHYYWQKNPRGSPALHQPAWRFVAYLQNHDQVANTFYGQRLHELTSPARLRAMTAFFLLAPHTPMLFMGQEFAASTPFAFFAGHDEELGESVRRGRGEFMTQFVHYATPDAQARLLDPTAPQTFEYSQLDFRDRERHAPTLALHRDLLALRRGDAVISRQDRDCIDGAVLSENAFVLRWFGGDEGDRLLLVNFGSELELRPMPEPLLAPARDTQWTLLWSSADPKYGGPGTVDPLGSIPWRLPAESASLHIATTAPESDPHRLAG